jgi:predicted protein tyrosine phosphatase
MSGYHLKWVTDHVAAGHAPISHDQLNAIKAAGVRAIVNLCGEYGDLHQIEADAGFDVLYLPLADECAPAPAEMEKAFAWMDAIIGRKDKILMHCRFGIGRTGTLLLAYLIRQGLTMKAAEKLLKNTGTLPSCHCQWKAVKKYNQSVQRAGKLNMS